MTLSFSIRVTIFCLLIFFIQNVNAGDIYANSSSYNDVLTAVNAASSGDKIFIPSGISDWGINTLTVPGGISLIGSGSANTIIRRNQLTSNYLISFDGSNGLPNELHDIGFEGFFVSNPSTSQLETKNYTNGVGFFNGCIDFIVSGCKFSKFANAAITVGYTERQKGVIFSNEFINNFYSSIANYGYGIVVYGGSTWPELELGTDNAVYIEDNLFSGNRHHIASNGGSRYVFRYNQVTHTDDTKNYAMTDAHGKSSLPAGSRSYEIYNNTYMSQTGDNLVYAAIGIRGGDGVIFDNAIDSKIIRTIALSAQGFPCGTYPGTNQTRSLYIWNNTNNDDLYPWANMTNGIVNACSSSLEENRDYFLEIPADYRPYRYPHPRRNVALRKPTTSSSNDSNHPSSFVVDGNISKERWWGANPHTITDQWWQVDLLDVYNLNEIVIIPYYDGIRYYNYTIQTSLDGIHWTTIINKNDESLSVRIGDIYADLNNINTRFLKVNMTYNSLNPAVHLIELKAYGTPSYNWGETNIASINQSITSSKKNDEQLDTTTKSAYLQLSNYIENHPIEEECRIASKNSHDRTTIPVTKDCHRHINNIHGSLNNSDKVILEGNKIVLPNKIGDSLYSNTSTSDLHIYPNPVIKGNDIIIDVAACGSNGNDAFVRITDVNGKTVFKKSFELTNTNQFIELNTNSLSTGINFLYVTMGKKKIKKIIVH
ncbi:discoidin domain-containing protein [Aquimarina pacifica]|uniref:discoidin domain-containing protein n=1 Tax=Aquimarina pacifica TaxID=1296415 RepID=UPI00046EBA28|nr:discoidin domain-containing protein [Aquimarina pacifica]